jgi:phosphoribosylamine--glycine ligase
MNVLLLGSGGREHAIAWKLARSPLLSALYIAPGNPGTARTGTNLPISTGDFGSIREAVLRLHIDLVVVGPEDPLVNGIHDFFLADPLLAAIPVIGPRKEAAQLEGSKDFAKQFMIRHGIPTARYQTFDKASLGDGIAFLKTLAPPYVLKADGLAAGKGVIICSTLEEAEHEFSTMITEARFGDASRKVVIEEFLQGIELSAFVLTDGKSYKILPEAKDYKKIGEGDTGPNTGGMGSVSPVPFAGEEFMKKVEERVIRPTVDGLAGDGIPYQGFIFFGLMNVKGDPFVIEYNCRLGDPETESVLPRLETDLLGLFRAVADGTLEKETIAIDPRFAATVMLVSKGYPEAYEKGKTIRGNENVEGSFVFHAGTALNSPEGQLVTSGGRVMAVTSYGKTMQEALERSYAGAARIEFDGKHLRNDIGFDL